MSGAPEIREAEPADAAVLAELGAATFSQTFGHLYSVQDLDAFLATRKTEGAYARLLREPGVQAWIAVSGSGGPVGFVLAGACKLPVQNLEPRAGEVRELYLLEGWQGHGTGTRLLETALARLEDRGHVPLYVGVWSENVGAQRLYARYGFEKVGEYDFLVGAHRDREFILRQPPR